MERGKDIMKSFEHYSDKELVDMFAGNRLAEAPLIEMTRRLKDSINQFNKESAIYSDKSLNLANKMNRLTWALLLLTLVQICLIIKQIWF